MKLVNYSIEHDNYNEVVTIYAITSNENRFSFSFSDTHTLKEVKSKLEELAEKIDNDSK